MDDFVAMLEKAATEEMKGRREKIKWREEASRRWTKGREGIREEMKGRECSVRKHPLADQEPITILGL